MRVETSIVVLMQHGVISVVAIFQGVVMLFELIILEKLYIGYQILKISRMAFF